MNDLIQDKIRNICTYYSELGEGTAGYSLSDKQFKELFDLFEDSLQQIREKTLEETREKIRGIKKYVKYENGRIDYYEPSSEELLNSISTKESVKWHIPSVAYERALKDSLEALRKIS